MLNNLLFACLCFTVLAAQDKPRNVWAPQYASRTAEAMAAQFENEERPVYRHRHDIVGMLKLKPGLSVAEIGAGSGFLSRIIAREVGTNGKAIATELDPKMVAYMNARAAAEGMTNFRAVAGAETATGVPASSMDAVVVVNTYSFFNRPREMMESIAATLKPSGLLLIVDFPRTRDGGADPKEIIRIATEAGFEQIDSSNVVPGHYAIRFRKKLIAFIARTRPAPVPTARAPLRSDRRSRQSPAGND